MYAPAPPQLGPIERMLIEAEAREEQERLRRFKRQVEYYQGEHRRQLKRSEDGTDDNVVLNGARSIVDKGVSFLFGKHLEFVLESERDGRPDQDTKGPAERWLDDCWDFNQQDAFLLEVGLNGARNGHAFVKVMLPQPQYGERYPRLINLDPATVTARHDPHDLRDVSSWRVQFTALDTRPDSPTRGKLVTFRQEITRLQSRRGWEIADWESLADSMRWTQVGPTVSWPYPNSPICHCKNLPNPNVFLGLSDLESDVLALVDARNFLLSNTQRIIRYHAHPKTVGKGFAKENLDVAVNEVIVLPNADSDLFNLEMQSDLASSLAFDQRLDEGLHQLTRIPPIAVGKVDDVGRLSGAAISLLYQPLLEMTETKRVLYGDNGLLGDINALLLAIGKFATEERPTITWPTLLPKDILEERQALLLDQQMGVASTQTLAEKLGYDWEQEVERREEEAQNMGSLLLDQMAAGTAQGSGVTNPQANASTGTSGPTPNPSVRGGVSRGGGQNG